MNYAFAIETPLDTQLIDDHSQNADLIAWAERTVLLKQRKTVPELMVRLHQLAESTIDTETRFRMLHAIKRPLLKTAAATGRQPRPGEGMSLGQRLYGAMADNLRILLEDIDRQRYGLSDERLEQRDWVVRNMIRFLQRQLIGSASAAAPWPPGVWQKLHDLFVYLVFRGNVELHGAQGECEAEHAYKWTLLMGLISDRFGLTAMKADVLGRLDKIASECRLIDSDGTVGEFGQILVEVGRDRPPRLHDGPVDEGFRGWVLRGPESLTALVCGALLD